jgi:hypothetical protein
VYVILVKILSPYPRRCPVRRGAASLGSGRVGPEAPIRVGILQHILLHREAAGLEDGRAGGAVTGLSRPVLLPILVRGGAVGLEDGPTLLSCPWANLSCHCGVCPDV